MAQVALVQGDDASVVLRVRRLLPVAGAPANLAVHPAGNVLFATDSSAGAALWRLNLDSGAAEPLAPPPGAAAPCHAVALSGDATVVACTRPRLRDVVLFANADASDSRTGVLAPRDADAPFAPPLQCLASCATNQLDVCAGAHPADQALCASVAADGGLQDGDLQPYGAVYVGALPTHLAALGDAAHPVEAICGAPSGQFSAAFAVATADGAVQFIGVRQVDGRLTPQLLTQDCHPPGLFVDEAREATPDAYLAPCPAHPQRARAACLRWRDTDAGVLALRSAPAATQVCLDWEGLVGTGEATTGQVAGDGSFVDAQGTAWAGEAGVAPRQPAAAEGAAYGGDRLVLEPLAALPTCREAAVCATQRPIVAVEALSGGAVRYRVDPPLDPACFVANRPIGYQLRAGHSFLVTVKSSTPPPPQRLTPGASYGLQSAALLAQGLLFSTQALAVDTAHNACELYAANGELAQAGQGSQSELLRHGKPPVFRRPR